MKVAEPLERDGDHYAEKNENENERKKTLVFELALEKCSNIADLAI